MNMNRGTPFIKLYISKRNEDVRHIINKMRIQDGGTLTEAVCKLIREGYVRNGASPIPRMDEFHKRKILYKSLSESLINGKVTDDQILDMYLSANSFLSEVKATPRLQRIIDRQLNGLTKENSGDLDKWFKE
jgi:hypothetical protein